MAPIAEVFWVAWRLGCTAFGGPVAHLGYFQTEYVERRRWLTAAEFADLVALCQFLPGPASSQVGMAIGHHRAGLPGMLAAWLGFTLPSAVAMIVAGYGVTYFAPEAGAGWLIGLKLAAVAVVAQALWSMAIKLCPDGARATLAALAAMAMLRWPFAGAQVGVVVIGAIAGWVLWRGEKVPDSNATTTPERRGHGAWWLAAFGIGLVGLPILATVIDGGAIDYLARFYRAGSLVFGGGHVVLPLLETETVGRGMLSESSFLAGYGLAQAVPGPLFTFAAYLGSAAETTPTGWQGGLICVVAIFLPSFLLIKGALPFWQKLRALPAGQAALRGANAAVVGLLAAAFYTPVITSSVATVGHAIFAVAAWVTLKWLKCPPWALVGVCGVAGALCW